MLPKYLTSGLCVLALILLNCNVISARTRYQEFPFQGCRQAGLAETAASRTPPAAGQTCLQFCNLNGYPYGGCDCKTKQCVCADMNLDFCRFQQIRVHI